MCFLKRNIKPNTCSEEMSVWLQEIKVNKNINHKEEEEKEEKTLR